MKGIQQNKDDHIRRMVKIEADLRDQNRSLKLLKTKYETVQKVGTIQQYDEHPKEQNNITDIQIQQNFIKYESLLEKLKINHYSDVKNIYEQMELLKQPLSDILQDFIKEKELMARQMDRYERLYRDMVANNEVQIENQKTKILANYLNTTNHSMVVSPQPRLKTKDPSMTRMPRFIKTRNQRIESIGVTTDANSILRKTSKQMKKFKDLQMQSEDKRQLSNLLDLMNKK